MLEICVVRTDEITAHRKRERERFLVNAQVFVCFSGAAPHLVTMAAILFSRSFLSAFSSNKLNTSSRVIGPVKGFPSPASPPTEPLEERRLSKLFRRSWPWTAGGGCMYTCAFAGGRAGGGDGEHQANCFYVFVIFETGATPVETCRWKVACFGGVRVQVAWLDMWEHALGFVSSFLKQSCWAELAIWWYTLMWDSLVFKLRSAYLDNHSRQR